jgi:DnaB-like helicase N terminal domain
MTGTNEAEAAVVARLLLDPREIPLVSGLTGDDFSALAWGRAFDAILSLEADHKPIDLIHLHALGVEVDVLDLPPMANAPIEEYVKLVRAGSLRRRVTSVAQNVIDRVEDPEVDPMAALQDAFTAIARVSSGEKESLGLVDLSSYRGPVPAPLLGVLSPEGTTVLYGDGGDGKGWVAAKWASQLDSRVAILDFEGHPNEWAYRLEKFGLEDPLYVSPSNTLEKWANERTARLLRDEEVKFLVVDSAMYASNVDDPYSPASALAYRRARARLGNLPTILLAHTTGGQDKVFGSVFWRNEARVVWRLNKDRVTRQRYLVCRKANNYSELEGSRLQVEFNEERGILNLHPYGQPWQPEETIAAAAPAVVEAELQW